MKKAVHLFGIISLFAVGCNSSGSMGNNTTYSAPTTSSVSGNGGLAVTQNTTRGKAIFEQRCVACHGEYGDLRHENAANLKMSRLDSIGIVQTIQNGRNLMPPFKDAIHDSDISQLAVYVKSLRMQ